MYIAFLQRKNYGSEEQINKHQGLVVRGREVVVTYEGSTKEPCDGTVLYLNCVINHTNIHINKIT